MARDVAKRGMQPVRWHYPDEPMRCKTGIVGHYGECLHCSADQGATGMCRTAEAIAANRAGSGGNPNSGLAMGCKL